MEYIMELYGILALEDESSLLLHTVYVESTK